MASVCVLKAISTRMLNFAPTVTIPAVPAQTALNVWIANRIALGPFLPPTSASATRNTMMMDPVPYANSVPITVIRAARQISVIRVILP